MNGYYNFGDIKNNVVEEDETSLNYIETLEKLDQIKVSCFMNVVVCKAKQDQWQSVVDVTDQVIEFAPENLKCWYWRGVGQRHVEEYQESMKSLKRAIELDPKHKPA